MEILSQFPIIYSDTRFQEMLTIIQSKANPEGLFIPESIWTKWKGWDCAQKKKSHPIG
jgi:hypothetical protein